MNILEIIKLSIENLLSFKFRSFLTMLGIIMGIASVVLLSSIGEGFQAKMLSETQKATRKIIVVDFNKKYSNSGEIKSDDYFTTKDETMLEKIEGVDKALVGTQFGAFVGNEDRFTLLYGANDKYFEMYSKKIIEGRKFVENDYNLTNKVIIISSSTTKRVFKDNNPLGNEIALKNRKGNIIGKYKIIGVYNGDIDDQSEIFGDGVPYEALLPFNELTNISGNREKKFSELAIKVKNFNELKKQTDIIKKFLESKGSKKDLYNVRAFSDELKQVTNILDKISIFINLVASISIIVGGVGVMNIMLVSVKERITEIGLRKAIGAKNKDIMRQFLIETMILTIIGGFIGILLGYSLAHLLGGFVKIVPVLKLKVVITAFIVSSLTGLIFGIYPAKQASKLSPMEALRKE